MAIGLHDGFGYWQAVIPGPLGVNPETPFGTVVSVSWPKDGGTYIIEVVGTGYFSVSIG